MDEVCVERHQNCKERMDSQAQDIKERPVNKVFYWSLGIFFVLIIGAYGYTQTVAADVKVINEKISHIVTKDDVKEMQQKIIDAIKGAR